MIPPQLTDEPTCLDARHDDPAGRPCPSCGVAPVQTFHTDMPVLGPMRDEPEDVIRAHALATARDGLSRQQGTWIEVHEPTYTRVDPLPWATVLGQDEEGNWLGSHDDYVLVVHLRVARTDAVPEVFE